MRKRTIELILAFVFIVTALWLLIFRANNVVGNLEASYIWGVPGLIGSHLALHRKIDKVHQTIKDNNNGTSN